MFCYQRNFAVPTENVGRQLLYSLMKGKDVAEKVALVRAIKSSGFDLKWLETEGYKEWYKWQKPDKKKAVDKMTDEKKVEAYCNGQKTSLPLVIFIANYEELPNKKEVIGRWRQKAGVCLNGLCVMDLDHVVKTFDGQAAKEYWQLIIAHLDLKEIGILMAFVSPSGDGLKIVFKARLGWGNIIDNIQEMAEFLGVSEYIDKKCRDGSRGHFLTTEQDLLYIDEEIFEYENKEFAEKYNAQYREGKTQGKLSATDNRTDRTKDSAAVLPLSGGSQRGSEQADSQRLSEQADSLRLFRPPLTPLNLGGEGGASVSYHGIAVTAIIEKLLGGVVPGQGDRHDKMRDLANLLRYVCDNSPKKVLEALMTQSWVMDLIGEGDPVEATVEGACKLKYGRKKPEELVRALEELGETIGGVRGGAGGGVAQGVRPSVTSATVTSGSDPQCSEGDVVSGVALKEWGAEIEAMFEDYPCLREVCAGLHREAYPAAMFTAAAFMGTLATRTWYFFYHRPEEERRLNYCIYIIGDPASGKSFATRLYRLLLAPIIAADRVGNDAINKYKKELKERGTSSKEQKKEPLKQPDVIIRIHGARTANGVFIEDMCKAIDVVGNKEIHLHMLTFDSELDSSTSASKGGQWIDKSTMELKAFHNEEDNQQYRNVDSVTGPFNVYWNYVYTGTPLSLHRKVTERNFGSGLSTRLAVIPLPPSDFKMMALAQPRTNYAEDEKLKEWAYKLDGVSGELPVWPLVEACWEWTRDHMAIAEINQDKPDELLLKRVPYYGISISVPFILMRHWDEWQEKHTFTIDEKDKALCELILNIQYKCQHHWFGEYARKYFDDMLADPSVNRNRKTKTKQCYKMLPESFTLDDVVEKFGCDRNNARVIASRLKKDGLITSETKGHYKKKSEWI